MDKIKIGLIGCGHLGVLHLKNLLELEKENEMYKLQGLYDIDSKKSERIASEYNVISYQKLDDLIENINAAFIITPTTSHYEIASQTIRKNIHTFIEKPVTENLVDAYKLLEIKPENLIVQVGHIERFNPAILSVEKYNIQPLFIEAHRLAQFNPRGTEVSVINDLMIHDLDIILSLVKSPIRSVEADGVSVLTGTVDIANVRLNFENGCVANITASRISLKKMRKMRIFQKYAYISIDFLNNSSEVFRLTKEKIENAMSLPLEIEGTEYNINYEKPEQVNINAMKYEEEQFLQSIITGNKPLVTLSDGIKALSTAGMIIEKIKSKNVGA